MADPELQFLYEVDFDLADPEDIGPTPQGHRTIFPVTGGRFEGPELRGHARAGGGDWLLIRPDGNAELDVRGTLETDDGALIYVIYRGILRNISAIFDAFSRNEEPSPTAYTLHISPFFQTSSQTYAWLNRVAAIGTGWTRPGGVRYRVFALTEDGRPAVTDEV